jgi:pterin-4a-carbinolamine dehydratase
MAGNSWASIISKKNTSSKISARRWTFTNLVGEMAELQNHHPDIYLAWGKVKVTIWTHKIDGLTESDFIFAAKTDQLLQKTYNACIKMPTPADEQRHSLLEIDHYIERLFVPRDFVFLQALRDAAEAGLPKINVSANEGKLLYLLARIAGAKRVLEIGLLGGYSAMWLAKASARRAVGDAGSGRKVYSRCPQEPGAGRVASPG